MNKNTAKDYLPLVQALAEGKVIQLQYTNGTWHKVEDPSFDLPAENYRIKPEPREIFVNEYKDRPNTTHHSKQSAASARMHGGVTRRYREVLE